MSENWPENYLNIVSISTIFMDFFLSWTGSGFQGPGGTSLGTQAKSQVPPGMVWPLAYIHICWGDG